MSTRSWQRLGVPMKKLMLLTEQILPFFRIAELVKAETDSNVGRTVMRCLMRLISVTKENELMTDEIDLSKKSMSELVALFNQKAEMMDGIKPVTRFADRKSAETRVRNIMNRVGNVAAKVVKSEEAAPETAKETPHEEEAFEVDMPQDESSTPPAETAETQKEEDMATKTKAKGKTAKPRAAAGSRKAKANGELVGKGSYRDKLLAKMTTEFRKQVPMSKLLVAVYGENRKDYRAPLMMVMKGLKTVLTANKTGKEIRKSRENKENCFGLYNRADPAIKA